MFLAFTRRRGSGPARKAFGHVALAMVVGAGALIAAGVSSGERSPVTLGERTGLRLATHQSVASEGDPVVAAAGDIACDPLRSSFNGGQGTSSSCKQMAVSDLLMDPRLDAVMPLGDNQYYCGGYEAFLQSYDPSWGRVKNITYPAVGNHEYIVDPAPDRTGCDNSNLNGAGYYRYFGAAAGDPSRGYYSYDIGTWHVIVLNSSCSRAGGCSASSPQGQWLRADLAAHPNFCTMAYWHIPLFSSGGRESATYKTFWDALYAADADLVLAGHDHTYERFAPQTPDGVRDDARGVRSFVVGTGGSNHTSFVTTKPNSEVRNSTTYGVLKLTLRPTSYDWVFEPIAGQTFTDSGTDGCHGNSSDSQAPTAPTGLTAQATSSTTVSLSWTASTDNVGVVGYKVFRNGAEIGTATSTSFTDDTAAASTSYTYTVRAYDAGGNTSAASSSASVTTPAGGGGGGTGTTLTFEPSADTYVREDRPTTQSGNATTFATDGNPRKHALLRFDVSGVTGKTVQDAKLRLYNVDASNNGGVVHTTTGSWTEASTWNTRPSPGPTIGSVGAVTANNWYEVDLSTLPTSDGAFNLLIDNPSSNGADYSSSEGSATLRPKLVLTVSGSGGGGGSGDTQAPTDPTGLTAQATSATSVALSWTGSTDNVGVTGYEIFRNSSLVGTSTSTSFTDATAVASTTYSYTVRAYDAANNKSGFSNAASVTTPAGGGGGGGGTTTLTFTATEDTYVRSDQPTATFGSATRVLVDGDPQKHLLLRFNVTGLNGRTVQSVKLRLFNLDPATSGGVVHGVNGPWSEGTVSWNTKPSPVGTLGQFGAVSANTWYEAALTGSIAGEGTFDLLLDSASSNGADYSSSEGAAGSAPQLILEVG